MIKFRQKIFVAPALVALGGKAMTALNVAGAVGTVSSVKQGADQMKQAEEQAAQAEEQNKKMTKALNKIAENAKNNPQAAQQAADVVGQRQFARVNLGKVFNNKNLQNAKGLAGDLGKIVWKGKSKLIGGTLMGGSMAAASYATDKYIQKDMKKNNIPLEKTYAIPGSVMNTVKGAGRVVGKTMKKHGGSIAGMAALGSIPTLLGYSAEKRQYKDQIESTQQRNYAAPAVGMAVKRFLTAGGNKIGSVGRRIKGSDLYKKPGETILGTISGFSGGGGKGGVYKFGHQLNRYGKHSGSEWSQKAGKFIMDHPKTSLAASIPVGGAIIGATWGTGEKLVNKTARSLDKNAFKYQDSKNEEIK